MINYIFDIDTKEGQIYVLEINNALYFRNYMGDALLYINQVKAADVLIENTSPYYDYNNTSSFSITFEDQYIKLLLDKFGPILYL